ncbi:MAG: cation diffusion facilitator CzcD-associated flavoprotein CzcO, partial [Gammaproteobacteria bacterium]
MADRYQLRKHIQFNSRVVAATYDEDSNLWHVTTDDNQERTATY